MAADGKNIQPSYGGFSVDLPHDPYIIGNDVTYDAEDKASGTHFPVIRTDIHNYHFAEEDTFDLGLMDESFGSAEFIEKNIGRKQFVYKGYPALDSRYKHKDGSVLSVRFIIQGPHYYTLVAHKKNDNVNNDNFFNSFELIPYAYKEIKERKDTSMYFSVATSWFPEEKKNKIDLPDEESYMPDDNDDDSYFGGFDDNDYKTRLVKNDTTGEAIFVSFSKTSRYEYADSVKISKNKYRFLPGYDTTWIIRKEKKATHSNGMKTIERLVSDTASSRAILVKTFYKNGLSFQLTTETDTLSQPSTFVKSFFENFNPADTLKIINPYIKKSKIFFDDFFGKDSVARKRAISSVWQIELDSTDLSLLTKAIYSFKWSEKKYLERKISFINKLGSIRTKPSAELLKNIYYAAGDTLQLQHSALEALLKQKTQYAFDLFKDIITTEPPVLENDNSYRNNYLTSEFSYRRITTTSRFANGGFIDELYDSLQLTRTILPGLLPLMTLDDYKKPIMRLLRRMVDSNLVTAKDYEIYFSKFLIEAKQELKKQAIEEKKSAIEKAENAKTDAKPESLYRREEGDRGNTDLLIYATLLLPFRETNPVVIDVLKKMLLSEDKRLKYNTVHLFLRHKVAVPDTMLIYFAKLDDYRYELFTDMKELKILDKFPTQYKNQRDLAKSKLFSSSSYSKPDSLVFIDSLPAIVKNKRGVVFFYKYKTKKDDPFWKLATVGLLSQDKNQFSYDDDEDENNELSYTSVVPGWNVSANRERIVYTEFTDEKIKDEVPLKEQMEKQLKKIVYSKRKSARMFYNERPDYSDMPLRYMD